MFPEGTPDPEYPTDVNQTGTRLDGRNLVEEWLSKHQVMRFTPIVAQQRPGRAVGLTNHLCPSRAPSMFGTVKNSFRSPSIHQ